LGRLIAGADDFLCVGHEQPDGDAVGSVAALTMMLQAMGKHVVGALPDGVPERYRFLPGADRIVSQPCGEFAVALIVDCKGGRRLAHLAQIVEQIPRQVVIDHHATSVPRTSCDYIDPAAAAVGVQILRLADVLGVSVTTAMATNLYTAIVTDTGFFRFENTNAEALMAAARCVEAGADPHAIAHQVTERSALVHKRLMGRAFVNSQRCCGGKAVISHLAEEDFRATGASGEHTNGIIENLKDIAGAQLIVLLKADGNNQWRVSLRSATVDVAAIAKQFGGGGHGGAAGCELTGTLAQVKQRVVRVISQVLQENQP